jgi:hypothetical protein
MQNRRHNRPQGDQPGSDDTHESQYQLRLATPEDTDHIGAIGNSLARAKGKAPRKSYLDAARRGELLVLEHFDAKDQVWHVSGILEWYTRVDGSASIKDAGTVGDEPNPGMIKRMVRELISLQSPAILRVKAKEEQENWNRIFSELPGFELEGKEYSRGEWVKIWAWTPDQQRAQASRIRSTPTFVGGIRPPAPRV